MVVVRYEGPVGGPGMPEMLDSTSRITTLCRERNIIVGLMTDGRFSGGSVGLVIGHVGPEAAIGGPIALIEDGDEIIVDLNKNDFINKKFNNSVIKGIWQIIENDKVSKQIVLDLFDGIETDLGDKVK